MLAEQLRFFEIELMRFSKKAIKSFGGNPIMFNGNDTHKRIKAKEKTIDQLFWHSGIPGVTFGIRNVFACKKARIPATGCAPPSGFMIISNSEE